VKEMPTLADRATKAGRRASRGETGLLRVGFTASSAFKAVVPGAIRAFRRAYADVELTLEEANTTGLVAGLQDGSLDAVFLRPSAGGSEAFQLRLVSEEPMIIALPSSHPVSAQQEVDLSILKNDPFLLFPRAVGPTLYDTIIDALPASWVRSRDRTIGSADRFGGQSGRCGTRRVDCAGVHEPAANYGGDVSRDRGRGADSAAGASASTRRNIRASAQLSRASDGVMCRRRRCLTTIRSTLGDTGVEQQLG
jgi:hypothetical protein